MLEHMALRSLHSHVHDSNVPCWAESEDALKFLHEVLGTGKFAPSMPDLRR